MHQLVLKPATNLVTKFDIFFPPAIRWISKTEENDDWNHQDKQDRHLNKDLLQLNEWFKMEIDGNFRAPRPVNE